MNNLLSHDRRFGAVPVVTVILILGMCPPARSQSPGTVNFRNLVPARVDAPMFDVDGVTRLSGGTIIVQLYAGQTPGTLSEVNGSPVPFLTGASAGYFDGGTRTVPFPPGSTIYVQVRFWEASFPTYDAAAAVGGGKFGFSNVILLAPGGGLALSKSRISRQGPLPAELIGLASSALFPPVFVLSRGIPRSFTNQNGGVGPGPQPTNSCGVPVGTREWYPFYTFTNGVATLTTIGSDFDTVVELFTGDPGNPQKLDPANCNNDIGIGQSASVVTLMPAINNLYMLSIAGFNGATGSIILNMGLDVAPAVNDLQYSVAANGLLVVPSETGLLRNSPAGSGAVRVSDPAHGALTNWNSDGSFNYRPNRDFIGSDAFTFHVINGVSVSRITTATIKVSQPARLALMFATGTPLQLSVSGGVGESYVIEATADFLNWLPLFTNTVTGGPFGFTDAQLMNYSHRFYRAASQ